MAEPNSSGAKATLEAEALRALRVRTGIPVLAAVLALVVFLTSLILETRERTVSRIGLTPTVRPLMDTSRVLLGPRGGKENILLGQKPPQTPATKVDELLARARDFGNADNLEGCAVLLRSALKLEPEHGTALQLLGMITFAQGDFATAESTLRRLEQSGQELDPMSRMRLAVAQMRLKKYGPSLKNLEMALEFDADDGAVHFALASVCSRLMDTERALYHFERAYAQLGGTVLVHLSDPHLDNLRSQARFQVIVQDARRRNRHSSSMSASPPAPAPEP